MPTQTVLDKVSPPFSPKARALVLEYRAAHPQGEKPVRLAAVEIARCYSSAWVIACHVRAAIAGKTVKDVGKFDLNDYVEPSDLAAKVKVKK